MVTGPFSYITEIELLSKKGMLVPEEPIITDMLKSCYKINHSDVLTKMVIDFRRKHNVKIPDAIIAASAKLLELPLITVDKGFAKIEDIDCIILDFKAL